jgi:beta-lactamase regulating signal transducer with metallopeptidase domain
MTHELAHICRFDLVVNLLQRLVEAMLFFHPAVWYISRQVSVERENATDDLVVASGGERARYADVLVRMAELSAALHGVAARSPTPRSATALAASEVSASDLKRRVLRLLEINEGMPRARISRGGGAALVMLSLLLVLPVVLPNWHIGAAAPVSVGNQKQSTHG